MKYRLGATAHPSVLRNWHNTWVEMWKTIGWQVYRKATLAAWNEKSK